MAIVGNLHGFLNFDLENFNNGFVFGLTCVVGFAFVLYLYFYSTACRPIGNSGESCSNPDCVRCIAKESLNSAIHERMECIIGGNESVTDVAMSDRLRKSFEYHLLVTKMEDFDNEYTVVGATKLQNPSVFYLQNLSQCHYFGDQLKNSAFGEVIATMRTHFQEVKEEFNQLWNDFTDGREQAGWQENSLLNEEGNWYAFHLINQGVLQTDNLDRSPVTSGLLEKLGAHIMKDCIFGFATFSVIMPGTHISRHCGATNVRARCHLGLVIPEGCTLTVNQEELRWAEGDCLVFDDSFQHEVHHIGDTGPRCVFMVDLWHSELTAAERKQLKYTFNSDLLEV